MGVAVWSGSLLPWERELAGLKGRFAPVFLRSEVRRSAGAFIDGVLSGIARKTGWLIGGAGRAGSPVSNAIAAGAEFVGCGFAA